MLWDHSAALGMRTASGSLCTDAPTETSSAFHRTDVIAASWAVSDAVPLGASVQDGRSTTEGGVHIGRGSPPYSFPGDLNCVERPRSRRAATRVSAARLAARTGGGDWLLALVGESWRVRTGGCGNSIIQQQQGIVVVSAVNDPERSGSCGCGGGAPPHAGRSSSSAELRLLLLRRLATALLATADRCIVLRLVCAGGSSSPPPRPTTAPPRWPPPPRRQPLRLVGSFAPPPPLRKQLRLPPPRPLAPPALLLSLHLRRRRPPGARLISCPSCRCSASR